MVNDHGAHAYRTSSFRFGALATGIPLLMLVLSSCSKSSGMHRKETASPVTVATAAKETVPIRVSTIGNVEAYSTVSIKALVGGELKQIYFKEGQDVEKGEKLFLIDPRPYEAALEQAKATLQRDRAQYKNAEQDVHRYQGLAKNDYVTQEQYEQIRTNAAALSATVMADDAMVKTAQLQLGYCSIDAPISGRTGDILMKAGNIVKANDSSPLVTIQQIRPIYVSFALPQHYVPDIREYSRHYRLRVSVVPSSIAAARPAAGTGRRDAYKPQTGELTFMDNTVDTTTGTIALKATFRNKRELLWPGESINVTLTLTDLPDAVVVPTKAIQVSQQGQYVFVVGPDNTVETRPIVSNYSYKHESIIERGVSSGETVVTDGQLGLVNGSKIEIKQ